MDCAQTQGGERKAVSVKETSNPGAQTQFKQFSGTYFSKSEYVLKVQS